MINPEVKKLEFKREPIKLAGTTVVDKIDISKFKK